MLIPLTLSSPGLTGRSSNTTWHSCAWISGVAGTSPGHDALLCNRAQHLKVAHERTPSRRFRRRKARRTHRRRRSRAPAGGDCGRNARTSRSTWSGSASPAQRRLCEGDARGLRRRRPLHRDRPCPHAERGRRRAGQRHRHPRRGFRRHLRGRPGACRRGHRAGGARRLRTPPSRRRRGAAPASRSASRPCAGSDW